MDGRLDFFRGWEEYKNGFGSLHGEHWLGLDIIHALTMQDEYHLFVNMYLPTDLQQGKAEYYKFFVGSEAQNYTLAISEYEPSSNAGDSLMVHNGLGFSTWDRDNDMWTTGNCALDYKSAWWFSSCHTSNLNAPYLRPPFEFAKGIMWQTWGGERTSMIYTEMKIKPRFL
ncbi:putative microfibril-associated glycoprotein 4-like [Apostichopus japonicus]|uniref:Putative microfibril-associated glycoprotein 4-like n=1 Tax=Stichopus japonicus TaxID=307972 RepID=A0A2G8KNJ8_STIJA|nr:putative microfibril-associated glycoprotein 4-like [Apostichopus japonicus]